MAVWSPNGNNTAKVSWALAQALIQHTSVALVELPCLGVPRLATEANLLDRNHHVDNAILEYERKNTPPDLFWQRPHDNLVILPANPYALPDHPTVHKVEQLDTLKSFPNFFLNQARKKGFSTILFDCQGGLTSPMTFFALRQAQKIILTVEHPTDLPWILINLRRLTETYNLPPSSFIATTTSPQIRQFYEEVEQVLPCSVLPIEKFVPALAALVSDGGANSEAKQVYAL